MSESTASSANRRRSRRKQPKGRVKVTCQRGTLGLGLNLALSVLDISETGVRMLVKEILAVGQEVSLGLEAPASARAVSRLGTVVWSVPSADGEHCIGVSFQKQLDYRDYLNLV